MALAVIYITLSLTAKFWNIFIQTLGHLGNGIGLRPLNEKKDPLYILLEYTPIYLS